MHTIILDTGWEFYKGMLGGEYEVWETSVHGAVSWKSVRVPHTYNAYDTVDPDRSYYQGESWYRIRLNRKDFREGRMVVSFEGGGPEIELFVGHEKVGSYYSCGETFNFDITDACAGYVQDDALIKNIPLAVRCSNRREYAALPTDTSGVCRWGGLFRAVHLIAIPDVSLKNIRIQQNTQTDESVTISIVGSVQHPNLHKIPLVIEMHIVNAAGTVVHTYSKDTFTGEIDEVLHQCTLQKPERWSLDVPHVYTCVCTLTGVGEVREIITHFGVRTIEFTPQGHFLLNGERVFLRGMQVYDDVADKGVALSDTLHYERLQKIKLCGANFVQFASGIQSNQVLDYCDALGLLVWEGIPWDGTREDDVTVRARVERSLHAMIAQHSNHPSVIIWGLCKGDTDTSQPDSTQEYMQKLHRVAHEQDPSRFTGSIYCAHAVGITHIHIPLISLKNEQHQYKEALSHALSQGQQLLFAAQTCEHIAGYHADVTLSGKKKKGVSPPTEAKYCHVVEEQVRMFEQMPALAGYIGAVSNDYAVPHKPHASLPYVASIGLLTRDMACKAGYYALQALWLLRPMVHMYGQGMKMRFGRIKDTKEVRVYASCREVELVLNGVSQGIVQKNGDVGFCWGVKFKKGKNILEAIGQTGTTKVHTQQEIEYSTERWGKPRKFRLKVKRFRHGRRCIMVQALDQKGCFCPDAELMVRFSVAGTGSLLDNRGTIEGSRVVQMTNGVAAIWALGNHGFSTVAITAPAMRTVFKRMR